LRHQEEEERETRELRRQGGKRGLNQGLGEFTHLGENIFWEKERSKISGEGVGRGSVKEKEKGAKVTKGISVGTVLAKKAWL